jgi:hypothetical protein
MKTKTPEDVCFDLASAASDMMTLHSKATQDAMCDAIARWQKWQIQRKKHKQKFKECHCGMQQSYEDMRDKVLELESECALAIDEMVNRFLSWKLPESVLADRCACERTGCIRYGTNLLSATEARQMIEHLMAKNSTRKADGKADGKPDGQEENTD